MSTRRVPQDYASIQAASDAADAGDTITVTSSYATAENVVVATDNLTFNGTSQAAVTLTLNGVGTIHIGGTLPFSVVADDDGATIYGSSAANTITGGNGVDKIFAGIGDTIYGGGSNDVISVHGKPVYVDGGDGRDVVRVTGDTSFAANSVVNVELFYAANDVRAYFDALDSSVTVRSLSRAGGQVTIRGSSAGDLFYDGAGADRFVGNAGTDTVSYLYSAAGVTANLAVTGGNTGSAAGDTYVGIENLTGSNFADVLKGDTRANVIDGGKGDDTIFGGRGDSLIGSYGDDTFDIDGAAAGVPISIDGDSSTIPDRLQSFRDVLHIIGDTTFTSEDKVVRVESVVVDDGVKADFSALSSSLYVSQYISKSVSGGGSTIIGEDGRFRFYGGLGADTLVDARTADFYVKATPALVKGGAGSTMYVQDDISVSSDNVKNIYYFEVSTGVDLDLSAYNYSDGRFSGVVINANNFGGPRAPSSITGTSDDDSITEGIFGGVVTGGKGRDFMYTDASTQNHPTTYVFHDGDTGLSADTSDFVAFTSGRDKIQIDGIMPSASTYAETIVDNATFDQAKAAATRLMADGSKDVVFIGSGAENFGGFLFWNAAASHTAPDAAIYVGTDGGLNGFDYTDLKAAPAGAFTAALGGNHQG